MGEGKQNARMAIWSFRLHRHQHQLEPPAPAQSTRNDLTRQSHLFSISHNIVQETNNNNVPSSTCLLQSSASCLNIRPHPRGRNAIVELFELFQMLLLRIENVYVYIFIVTRFIMEFYFVLSFDVLRARNTDTVERGG